MVRHLTLRLKGRPETYVKNYLYALRNTLLHKLCMRWTLWCGDTLKYSRGLREYVVSVN
jgi:hypothetical protein